MSEQTYGEERARNLEAMLRALAERINDLDERRQLLSHAGELLRLIGDVRSELFHYEVRATYDTPEVAENRRIVSEALTQSDDITWQRTEWTPDEDQEDRRDPDQGGPGEGEGEGEGPDQRKKGR